MMENTQQERLDTQKAALVAIDLQNGVVQRPHAPYTGAQVVENARKLAEAFLARQSFVVLVRVSTFDGRDMLRPRLDTAHPQMQLPEGWDAYVPPLARLEGAYSLTKRQLGAFYGTDLDLQLRRRGIDTIVLCGISTHIGVDTTAREAYQSNYHQIFVGDAMTADTEEQHDFVCRHIFPRLGRIRSTEAVLRMLDTE